MSKRKWENLMLKLLKLRERHRKTNSQFTSVLVAENGNDNAAANDQIMKQQ
ncbi:hypothetical protein EVAR_71297_1, partial [Eumeta japonica]